LGELLFGTCKKAFFKKNRGHFAVYQYGIVYTQMVFYFNFYIKEKKNGKQFYAERF